LIAAGKYSQALALIRQRTPFASACGRICHHPCERDCNRSEGGDPVTIMALKRLAAQWGETVPQGIAPPSRPQKIAVVGGGPAGLTAGLDLRRHGYAVTVLDAAPRWAARSDTCSRATDCRSMPWRPICRSSYRRGSISGSASASAWTSPWRNCAEKGSPPSFWPPAPHVRSRSGFRASSWRVLARLSIAAWTWMPGRDPTWDGRSS